MDCSVPSPGFLLLASIQMLGPHTEPFILVVILFSSETSIRSSFNLFSWGFLVFVCLCSAFVIVHRSIVTVAPPTPRFDNSGISVISVPASGDFFYSV